MYKPYKSLLKLLTYLYHSLYFYYFSILIFNKNIGLVSQCSYTLNLLSITLKLFGLTKLFITERIFEIIKCRLEDEKEHPLPLHLEPLPLPRDAICMFPTVGTILRVIGDRANEKLALRSLNTGKWVKFLNIIFEVHAGLWRGVLMPFTKVRYIPSENRIVSQRQRLLSLQSSHHSQTS